nr:MAG TPA: protein of unknown function (DUF5320) [Caudoviricetes sp.]
MGQKFIKTENTKVVYTHFMPFDEKDGLKKTEEELLQEGYLIDEIPEPDRQEGKIAEAHYTPEQGYYYEYVDAPEPKPQGDIAALRAEVDELKSQLELTQSALDAVIMGV